MYCSSCGAKNVAESNYCRQCGLKLAPPQAVRVSEEAFDRAMPEDEKVAALLELAYRRRKDGDLDASIALCNEVVGIRPESTTAHGLLGQLYEQTGDREKAVAQYEKVLKLNPGSIADRVKLDDLREGRAAAPRRAPLSVALPVGSGVDPNGAAMRGGMIWGVGLVALLMLSGAALAIMFSRRPESAPTSGIAASQGTAKTGTPTAAPPTAGQPGADQADRSAAGSPANGSVFGNVLPTYGIVGQPVVQQYAQPPIYIYPPGYGQRQGSARAAVAARSPKSAPSGEQISSDPDGGVRIHLSSSDAPARDSSAHDASMRDNGAADGARVHVPAGPEQSIIHISASNKAVDPVTAYAASSEATAYMSAGLDKMNRMDYNGAISAFKKALGSGTNDDTAYVYENLGHCYENLTQNSIAVQMYEKARAEYQKLVTEGRQLERANKGISVCENGIKLCKSE